MISNHLLGCDGVADDCVVLFCRYGGHYHAIINDLYTLVDAKEEDDEAVIPEPPSSSAPLPPPPPAVPIDQVGEVSSFSSQIAAKAAAKNNNSKGKGRQQQQQQQQQEQEVMERKYERQSKYRWLNFDDSTVSVVKEKVLRKQFGGHAGECAYILGALY